MSNTVLDLGTFARLRGIKYPVVWANPLPFHYSSWLPPPLVSSIPYHVTSPLNCTSRATSTCTSQPALFFAASWRWCNAPRIMTLNPKSSGCFSGTSASTWFVPPPFHSCLSSANTPMTQEAQVELLALFSGCTLRALKARLYHPWLFGVFEWLRHLVAQLRPRHAESIVSASWLPEFVVSPVYLCPLFPPFTNFISSFHSCPWRGPLC